MKPAPRQIDASYRARVAELPCCVCGIEHLIAPHHAGRGGGVARKADDSTCVPLCHCHHDEAHRLTGYFKGWTREQRREWAAEKIVETKKLLGAGA